VHYGGETTASHQTNTEGYLEMKKSKDMEYVVSQFEQEWRARDWTSVGLPEIENPKAAKLPPYSRYGRFVQQLKWWSFDAEQQIEIDTLRAHVAKEYAGTIDPATAEVGWQFVEDNNPYEIEPIDSRHWDTRMYYARAPWSDVWVWFGDLPVAVRDALWAKHREKLLSDNQQETEEANHGRG
jgi:hypothetical protein